MIASGIAGKEAEESIEKARSSAGTAKFRPKFGGRLIGNISGLLGTYLNGKPTKKARNAVLNIVLAIEYLFAKRRFLKCANHAHRCQPTDGFIEVQTGP
jgi:hypothetical protein